MRISKSERLSVHSQGVVISSATHIRLYPVTVPGEEAAKAAPVDIIGPQATSQFDALLAAQRDLQQQAKNDPAWSKQR